MKSQLTRIDTLIITVGTRQVGWLCQDGNIRCLGADGDRGHPPHINELYQELDIQRQYHDSTQSNSIWSVRDLGYRYYEHCQEWLGGDFSAVELLLDWQIIVDAVVKGLKHIILWATDQPETVPWVYRRTDTFWLAKLMEGKIKSVYPNLIVDVLHPIISANNRDLIRQEIEGFILPIAVDAAKNYLDNDLVLAIQNKGAVPAIAEGLEICAAALVRQFLVVNTSPIEPQPLYQDRPDGKKSACVSQAYQTVFVSEYFWPIERERIISAWERGDFQEAKIWLKSHQNSYKFLYQLAGFLSISGNWEIAGFINNKEFENNWLRSRAVAQLAGSEIVQGWREQLWELRLDKYAEVWESTFFTFMLLKQGNYTAAFYQFSQILERLLFLRYQQESWVEKQFVKLPGDFWGLPENFNPGFKKLIDGWFACRGQDKNESVYQLFDKIRNTRNDIVHKAKPISAENVIDLWESVGWKFNAFQNREIAIKNRMLETLEMVMGGSGKKAGKTLIETLYEWGLNVLKSEEILKT